MGGRGSGLWGREGGGVWCGGGVEAWRGQWGWEGGIVWGGLKGWLLEGSEV